MRPGRSLIRVLLLLALPGIVPAVQAGDPAGRPGEDRQAPPVSRSRYLMGVPLEVTLPGPAAPALFEAVFAEVSRLESVLSNWRDDSELSRLNRSAATAPVRCSADLFESILRAVSWAEDTGGAFDPTVEPIVRGLGLLGDPYDGRPRAHGHATSGKRGNWRGLSINRAARTVGFASEGMGIDMGGIGKGIALDAAARVLREAGRTVALLDFGGQVLAMGAPPGEPGWIVDLADPDDRDRTLGRVRVRDLSLSTSAPGGRRGPGGEGHIIDPRTGAPAGYSGSVTVAAPDATGADALSTALCVMGVEAGADWARRRGVAALFARRDAAGGLEMRSTEAFDRIVMEDGSRRPPEAGAASGGR